MLYNFIQNPDRAAKNNHEFSMRLLTNYKDFQTSLSKRIDIASKLASAFGDSDASNLRLVKTMEGINFIMMI